MWHNLFGQVLERKGDDNLVYFVFASFMSYKKKPKLTLNCCSKAKAFNEVNR